ncbi:hypothetical protein Spock_165 [Bacillus phage Spock]|uniref:Uncharacterized protein n=2 Tax=Bequatrovirus spock TaxID=1918008 RepID=A0A1X9SGE9_9CAUD|nr:hypothetical protein Spock_165 [Bacillus phage Spock]AGY48565.1 hypothetical protein Spock_165 [Bacillus phage Spock]ARQ95077.1 hypothetical protein FLAPJACK_166 [Bacillus phage Flapjack]
MSGELKVTVTFSMKEYDNLSKEEKVDYLQEIITHTDYTYSLGISTLVIESEE